MNSLITGIFCTQEAVLHLEDAIRQDPGSIGANLAKIYLNKLKWIVRDFKTCPSLPTVVVAGIHTELREDNFLNTTMIFKKFLELPIEQREKLEQLIDLLNQGESIEVEVSDNNEEALKESHFALFRLANRLVNHAPELSSKMAVEILENAKRLNQLFADKEQQQLVKSN